MHPTNTVLDFGITHLFIRILLLLRDGLRLRPPAGVGDEGRHGQHHGQLLRPL